MPDLTGVAPRSREILTYEVHTIQIDTTGEVAVGDVITNATAVMSNDSTGETVGLAILGAPSIAGNLISVTVSGEFLRPQYPYTLTVTYNATGGGGSSKTLTAALAITVAQ